MIKGFTTSQHIILAAVYYGTNSTVCHFSWAVMRTCVAAGCNKTYADGVAYTNESKDSKTSAAVSMLFSQCNLTGYYHCKMPDML